MNEPAFTAELRIVAELREENQWLKSQLTQTQRVLLVSASRATSTPGKRAEHLQEGFNQATSGFLSLQGFKDRESGRKRPEVSEGSVHQGDEISEALKKSRSPTPGPRRSPECNLYGHRWRTTEDQFIRPASAAG